MNSTYKQIKPKRVLMILQTTFPPDIRVENEVLSLVKNSDEIHILCRNKGQQKQRESWSDAIIHRLVHAKSPGFLKTILQIPVFLNPYWFIRSAQIIRRYSIDVIHVHDLPLAPLAILLKYIFGLSIIYDMHENYPAALRVWKKRGLEYWLKHPAIFKLIEHISIRYFDRLIAVVDENKNRIIEEYKIPDNRVYVVSNYVNLDTFLANTPYDEIKFPSKQTKIFLYTGGLEIHRGMGITIEAFRRLSKDYEDVLLLIVGGGLSATGKKLEVELKEKIEMDIHLKGKVILTGGIDIKYIPWLIEKSDYCLLPQGANDHTNTTIPHKIFQYMSFGKPVITADALPAMRVISEARGGYTFKSGNIDDYHSAMERILKANYLEISNSARNKTRELYSWYTAERELLALYDSLH